MLKFNTSVGSGKWVDMVAGNSSSVKSALVSYQLRWPATLHLQTIALLEAGAEILTPVRVGFSTAAGGLVSMIENRV